jgi:hypothetical protein
MTVVNPDPHRHPFARRLLTARAQVPPSADWPPRPPNY